LFVEELEFHVLGSLLGLDLDGVAHDHLAVLRTGDRTADQQERTLRVDADASRFCTVTVSSPM
jgi:hypothetical protein